MITEIVTHGSPAHLDELMTYLLLKRYGEEKLPGVSTASFRCLQQEDDLAQLKEQGNVVLIGLGAGTFDEHVFNGDDSKKDECAATLVAEFLGIAEELRWKKILRYVLHTDKNPSTLALDLASMVMLFQKQGMALERVLSLVELAVDARLQEQTEFSEVLLEDIREEPLHIQGNEHYIAIIESNHGSLVQMARFQGAAVVVVKNPDTGHTQVLTTNRLYLDMRDVIRLLRIRELLANGRTVREMQHLRWPTLEQEGAIDEVPQWFFHKEANNALNGGRSRPDIPPTKLNLEDIIEVVKMGLEQHRFVPNRQEQCKQGVCTSTLKNSCPWYAFGLVRCRTIRGKAREAKAL